MSDSSTISVFARIRPTLRTTPTVAYDLEATKAENPDMLHFHLPRQNSTDIINNSKEEFDFSFSRVFDPSTRQEEVFDVVAKDVVQSVLDGYNGTIFAYGQTGSGKTFTITGGAERYDDRGLIPRSIQYICAQIAEKSKTGNVRFQLHISYLELYNQSGYDLLDDRQAKKLEDLQKVTLQEDEDGTIHMRNLSCVPVSTQEEALDQLFIGDTNKMIAETPSNPASSRSHCIFIIQITTTNLRDDTVRRSKLHLVDLAGSERVSRTQIDGTLLREAKYINSSLHYLEQVIIALHEKANGKRIHVPYRNSMMTSVLRDSLGGNCKTTMIATLAVETQLAMESISTCRFAQRVALIKNEATVNERIDPHLVIARLKKEIVNLKAELALKGGWSEEPLEAYEVERCSEAVDDYMRTGEESHVTFSDYRKVYACFKLIRERMPCRTQQEITPRETESTAETAESKPDPDVKRLKAMIAQRDSEIAVLVSMLNELKGKKEAVKDKKGLSHAAEERSSKTLRETETTINASVKPSSETILTSQEKATAFKLFLSTYDRSKWIEQQKANLKQKYSDAKYLGDKANEDLKIEASKIRQMDEVYRLAHPGSGESEEETLARTSIADYVIKYKQAYQDLKERKLEIEHIQHLLENARIQLQKDFETWMVTEWPNVKHQIEKKARTSNWEDSIVSTKMKRSDSKSSFASRPASRSTKDLYSKRNLTAPVATGLPTDVHDDIAAFYAARNSILHK